MNRVSVAMREACVTRRKPEFVQFTSTKILITGFLSQDGPHSPVSSESQKIVWTLRKLI